MLAVPALAAEDNIEIVDDHYLVKTNIDTDKVTLEDNTISYNGENKQIDVNIIASGATKEVSSADVANAYERAMESYKRDMVFDANGNPDGTFDYTLVGEDEIYFYEQTADSPMQADMDVICLTQEDKAEMKSEYAQRLIEQIGIERGQDGYFGRVYVENSSIYPSSCDVMLPRNNEISVNNGILYIYTGFSGGKNKFSNKYEADMGVQFSEKYGLWKAFMTISGGADFLSNYKNVVEQNGYLPNTKVSMVCIIDNKNTNVNGTNDNKMGSVMLKVYGTAKYKDKYGNGGNTPLTSIMESNETFKLVSVNYHKWLATIAGGGSSGHNIGRFSNVAIDGVIQAENLFQTQKEGIVTFSGMTDGAFTIDVRG